MVEVFVRQGALGLVRSLLRLVYRKQLAKGRHDEPVRSFAVASNGGNRHCCLAGRVGIKEEAEYRFLGVSGEQRAVDHMGLARPLICLQVMLALLNIRGVTKTTDVPKP